MEGDCGGGEARGFSEEGAFSLVGFDEMKMKTRGNSQDQPWKSSAGSYVDRVGDIGRDQFD